MKMNGHVQLHLLCSLERLFSNFGLTSLEHITEMCSTVIAFVENRLDVFRKLNQVYS